MEIAVGEVQVAQVTIQITLQMLFGIFAACLAGAAYLGWSLGRWYRFRATPVRCSKKMPKIMRISRKGEKAHCTDQCSSLPQKADPFPACNLCAAKITSSSRF